MRKKKKKSEIKSEGEKKRTKKGKKETKKSHPAAVALCSCWTMQETRSLGRRALAIYICIAYVEYTCHHHSAEVAVSSEAGSSKEQSLNCDWLLFIISLSRKSRVIVPHSFALRVSRLSGKKTDRDVVVRSSRQKLSLSCAVQVPEFLVTYIEPAPAAPAAVEAECVRVHSYQKDVKK